MNEDYGTAPLSKARATNPEAVKDQLLEVWSAVEADHGKWLRTETEAMGAGAPEEVGLLLLMSPAKALVTSFHRLSPELPLSELHRVNPLTIVAALLRLLTRQ